MEMPTPCILCNEIFDLTDGRGGLTHQTSNTTICSDCYDYQESHKERVDVIREQLEKIEDNESAIETCIEEISELKDQIKNAKDELEDSTSVLDEKKYRGVNDEYHELIDMYY